MIIDLPEQVKITLLTDGETRNKAELMGEVDNVASQLQNIGIERGDQVVIIASYQPTFFAALLGAWRVGACVACVNSSITPSELENICTFTEAKVILGLTDLGADLDVNIPFLNVYGIGQGISLFEENPSSNLDDDALILFTSGTTGEPKGVTHTFRSLFSRIAINRAEIGDQILQKTLCPLPTHFGHGLIGNCLTTLFAGGHLYLIPGISIDKATRFGDLLDDHEITFMSSVPAMWRIILRLSKKPNKEYLRRVHVGSAPLSAKLWGEISAWCSIDSVWNMYGITEACNWIGGRSYIRGVVEDGQIGTAWGGSFAIKLEDGSIANSGKGELLVQTPSLMRGYLKRPEISEQALQNGWFHTGDVATIDDMGIARLIGRQKSEINRAGLKIHPEDIDILLERHDFVREACAFPIEDSIAGQIVGVAIVAEDETIFDLDVIKLYCRKNLIVEKNPERWFVIQDIPKTDRGKINREKVAVFCLSKNET